MIINILRSDNATYIHYLRHEFINAKPFPHVLIDDFLDDESAIKLYKSFPAKTEMSRHYNGLNEQKSEGTDFERFDPLFLELRNLLRSQEFCNILTRITGIEGLFTPEDSLGSGIHLGENGSFLDVHVDFNIHTGRNIHRRVNVLLFLNKDWQISYGGALELWNAEVTKMEQSYLPLFNTCVIFETSDTSYHGYSKIVVPEGVNRRSFFSYYYTSLDDYSGKYHDTVFRSRPTESLSKKIRTNTKEWLKNSIKRMMYQLTKTTRS